MKRTVGRTANGQPLVFGDLQQADSDRTHLAVVFGREAELGTATGDLQGGVVALQRQQQLLRERGVDARKHKDVLADVVGHIKKRHRQLQLAAGYVDAGTEQQVDAASSAGVVFVFHWI